jgi:hypothetical protein
MKIVLPVGAALVAALATSVWGAAEAQSFSCSFGEPACLDYGAVVCKSSAMCVSKDAICFDSYTCDYKGFICKSKFDDAVEEIDDRVRKYNSLVEEFNTLNDRNRSLRSCLDSASSLEDAKGCV